MDASFKETVERDTEETLNFNDGKFKRLRQRLNLGSVHEFHHRLACFELGHSAHGLVEKLWCFSLPVLISKRSA